jgi:hypothetical protein
MKLNEWQVEGVHLKISQFANRVVNLLTVHLFGNYQLRLTTLATFLNAAS